MQISADLILCEDNNRDEIYIVRYYFDEYRIGKRKIGTPISRNIHRQSDGRPKAT